MELFIRLERGQAFELALEVHPEHGQLGLEIKRQAQKFIFNLPVILVQGPVACAPDGNQEEAKVEQPVTGSDVHADGFDVDKELGVEVAVGAGVYRLGVDFEDVGGGVAKGPVLVGVAVEGEEGEEADEGVG